MNDRSSAAVEMLPEYEFGLPELSAQSIRGSERGNLGDPRIHSHSSGTQFRLPLRPRNFWWGAEVQQFPGRPRTIFLEEL